jgi:hypothetical protein
MSETPLHTDLVASLLSAIASQVAAVTHAAGRSEFPDPPKVGRHEPDLYLLTDDGLLVLGEAKTGPDLSEERTHEQIEDYSKATGPNDERATFWLCVPDGYADAAWEAIDREREHLRLLRGAGPDRERGPRAYPSPRD